MENSIEEDIKIALDKFSDNKDIDSAILIVEKFILGNYILKGGRTNIVKDSLRYILSDYKRVLKENEELNNRCKNLDKEAQAYVEELMGDSTLKDRIINRLNKENEELKAKWNKDTHILQNKLDYANADRIDLAQQNKELRKENNRLEEQVKYDKTHIYTPQTIELNFISKSKIEDKIEEMQKEYNKLDKEVDEYINDANKDLSKYYENKEKIGEMQTLSWCIDNLQELLQFKNKDGGLIYGNRRYS